MKKLDSIFWWNKAFQSLANPPPFISRHSDGLSNPNFLPKPARH